MFSYEFIEDNGRKFHIEYNYTYNIDTSCPCIINVYEHIKDDVGNTGYHHMIHVKMDKEGEADIGLLKPEAQNIFENIIIGKIAQIQEWRQRFKEFLSSRDWPSERDALICFPAYQLLVDAGFTWDIKFHAEYDEKKLMKGEEELIEYIIRGWRDATSIDITIDLNNKILNYGVEVSQGYGKTFEIYEMGDETKFSQLKKRIHWIDEHFDEVNSFKGPSRN